MLMYITHVLGMCIMYTYAYNKYQHYQVVSLTVMVDHNQNNIITLITFNLQLYL